MKYILQSFNGEVDLDVRVVEDLMKSLKRKVNYTFSEIEGLKFLSLEDDKDKYVPIGTLQFVGEWLKQAYNIKNINPIEIPEILRTKEFLKRDYRIVSFDEIPRKGYYFLKDVSVLKTFSYTGMMEELNFNLLDKTHLYQVSSILNVRSEYRVYVIDDNIEAIEQYDGMPLDVCDVRYIIDRGLLIKAKSLYELQKDHPKSYTIDLMVGDFGTAICEIHPFISVGLYTTLWGFNLLKAYRDGIDYVIQHNTQLEKFSVEM